MEGVWESAFELARAAFAELDPEAAASRVLAGYTAGAGFEVGFLSTAVRVSWPAGIATDEAGERLGAAAELIVLHYLCGPGGESEAGEWVAYRDLPGGRNYESAFRREAELPLARAIGTDLEPWRRRGLDLGLEREDIGDLAYSWRALPLVRLLITLTPSDDEFEAEARVLFDRGASRHLHTEDLAVLGELAARVLAGERLARAAGAAAG
ncbi:MAG: DUF3786 domain-containing protein [Candidatus Geothermincolia bacterium]